MNLHSKKLVAPIVVTVLMIFYYVAYFGLLMTLLSGILKWIFGVIPLLLSAEMIKVCLERIKEIKKGEEDDISKY